ncbi:hypothetical protein BJF84_14805 [Rhodococcus sp. CUA-806]|jgi:hypothetical protein|nr:hypothetical protein BJF84_14805 [Rhodococcus sp. CUA-806]
MRKTTTAVLAVTAVIPLAFAAAAPAAAAPGDVAAVFTTVVNTNGGNSVTGTFATANGVAGYCRFVDLGSETGDETFPYELEAFASPPIVGNSVSGTDPSVPDGIYTIDWICYTVNFDVVEATTGFDGTAEPTTLEVPAVVPKPVCTGSVCLPTGSFGF